VATVGRQLKAFRTQTTERARDVVTAKRTRVQMLQTFIYVYRHTHIHTQVNSASYPRDVVTTNAHEWSQVAYSRV